MTNDIDKWHFNTNDFDMTEKTPLQSSVPNGVSPVDLDLPSSSRIPLSMTQKTAAKRMLQSVREIPQFSVSMEVNADKLAVLRSRINADIEDQENRISITALLIWITARALLKHPRLNGQFDEDAIIQHDFVNMAVAMDTPQGLTVPVIHGVDTLSVRETAEALKDLVKRATSRLLSMSDFTNATFTISNLGMFDVARFTPLINPPQAAIMGVSAPRDSIQRDSSGALVPARVMEMAVTADHRILDGAEVARFLQTLRKSVMENDAIRGLKSSGRILAGVEEEK